jgi:hypothetical protein
VGGRGFINIDHLRVGNRETWEGRKEGEPEEGMEEGDKKEKEMQ